MQFHSCSSGYPRDLHSFPTRRFPICRGLAAAGRAEQHHEFGVADLQVEPVHGGDAAVSFGQLAAASPPWTGSDRKSTRLNSSHLGISYAVFCLKKKKE